MITIYSIWYFDLTVNIQKLSLMKTEPTKREKQIQAPTAKKKNLPCALSNIQMCSTTLLPTATQPCKNNQLLYTKSKNHWKVVVLMSMSQEHKVFTINKNRVVQVHLKMKRHLKWDVSSWKWKWKNSWVPNINVKIIFKENVLL